MIDSNSDCRDATAPREKPGRVQRGILAGVCALVIGLYAYTAHSGFLVWRSLDSADAYYNLLVQGFRAGQLNVKKDVPPGLAQLPNPYDPIANAPYRVLDLSYYKGKLYLYFGVTPAVLLFWPYVALSGHYLLQKDAVLIFCVVGFLASAGLLYALWKRYFAKVSVGVVAAGTLALGVVPLTPFLMARSDVYEVSISCGYALTMLALSAIWKALHEPDQRERWLAAASLAYGLAVGARPSLLPGAVILLVPVVQAWREHGKVWVPLMAAAGPIALIGLGLMHYNALRFDDPFEFGLRYQLAGDRQSAPQQFSLRYLWFNFRVYFLEPAHWNGRFPFVHDISVPPLPAGHGNVDKPFGILTNIPLVWLALAAPLAWRGRLPEARSILRGFLGAVVLFFGICTLTACTYFGTCTRYEVEFLSVLVLLAVVGILSLERVLAPTSGPGRTVRWSWGVLLGLSVAFNLLLSVERCAEAHDDRGFVLKNQGRVADAIAEYERALWLVPDYAEAHSNLGFVLKSEGKLPEAVAHYEQAVRLKPDLAEAHNNLGVAFEQMGRFQEAIACYERALQLKASSVEAQYNLGLVLWETDKPEDAIKHWQEAVRLRPDFAQAHSSLGVALARLGRWPEAIEQDEQALRLRPDSAVAFYELGVALEQSGRVQEAMENYEQALRLKPDFAEAQSRLAQLRATQ